MAWALFKANIRNNRTIWVLMTLVLCMYFAIMISMFDPVSAQGLEQMLEMLPEAMARAFGFSNIGTTLTTFLASYLYGFLVLLFPMVISIVVNHGLVASHVDKGSMAYLLATPNSRRKIATTQAVSSLASITAFFVLITVFVIAISQSMFPGELEIGKFVLINVYALLMYFAIGGIGFFASCIAEEGKQSLRFGIGLPVGFLLLKLLGDAGERFSWIGNLSLYKLFDPIKLVEGASFAYIGMILFALIAVALYTGGIAIFNKRDMHV